MVFHFFKNKNLYSNQLKLFFNHKPKQTLRNLRLNKSQNVTIIGENDVLYN